MATTKQRRRALARAKWERQQQRRSQHAQRARRVRRRVVVGLAIVAAAVLVGLGLRHFVRPGSTGSAAAVAAPAAASGPLAVHVYTPGLLTGTETRLERSAA